MQVRNTLCVAIGLIITFLLAGCSPIVEDVSQTVDIYTTFYPVYALTERIAQGAEDVEIHCLVQPQDECLRMYELSDWDLYMLAYSADAVIAAGNGLEGFESKLHELGETVFPVADVFLGIPMEGFEDLKYDEDSHFAAENPHIYMSIDNASEILDNITGALSILDAENADLYESNRMTVQSEIEDMKTAILERTKVCSGVRVAVLHEALLYPALEYGLSIEMVFERESGEELYDENLAECLKELENRSVQLVLLERQAPKNLVDSLVDAGYRVVQLDIMSTHRESDGFAGYVDGILENARMVSEVCRNLRP